MAQPVVGASGPDKGVLLPPPVPQGSVVLYDQTGGTAGFGYTSQKFQPANAQYDSQLADDFVVPSAEGWDVTQINVLGNSPGAVNLVNVWIYDDNAGAPGTPVCTYTAIAANGVGNLNISLPTDCVLTGPATYWVSVQADLDSSVGGQWFWSDRSPQVGNPAQWQNPADGFATGCTTWTPMGSCFEDPQPDLAFAVVGRQNVDTARFAVNKDFSDDNPAEVNVTLSCTTGLPIIQSQMISEEQGVVFIVESYADGEMKCTVTEEEVFGYVADYYDGIGISETSCIFDNIPLGGNYNCDIVNTPYYVDVDIRKEWIIEGIGGDAVDLNYRLTIYCDTEISGGTPILYSSGAGADGPGPFACGGGGPLKSDKIIGPIIIPEWCLTLYGHGSDDFTALVRPEYPGSNCWVEETVYDSSVEVDNGCYNIAISAGIGDSCLITNTVFFEGIPTLSQYGMAILALLMLGVGFVGFRRMV